MMQPVPMRLLRLPQPFDHPDFLFELKYDGFRALAIIDCRECRLVSRHGNVFPAWPSLCADIVSAVDTRSAVLDGEIVCLDDEGRPNFESLLFRRGAPWFYAFDLLQLDQRDVRSLPLLERKRILRQLVPRRGCRMRYVDYVPHCGTALHRFACRQDLEGVVAKWMHGTYQSGPRTSWLKIKNVDYSQTRRRHEFFQWRGAPDERPVHHRPPELCLV